MLKICSNISKCKSLSGQTVGPGRWWGHGGGPPQRDGARLGRRHRRREEAPKVY